VTAEGIDFVAGRFLALVRDLEAATAERDQLRSDAQHWHRVATVAKDQRDDALAERDEARAELEQLRTAVHRVEALLAHARLVSPSTAMTVYVADVETALAGNPPREDNA